MERYWNKPMRLGDYLVSKGWITEEQLHDALEHHNRTGERLGRVFISLKMIKRYQLFNALAELWGLPFVNLLETDIDQTLAKRFDEAILVRYHFLPYEQNGNVYRVATAERPDPDLDKKIHTVLGIDAEIDYHITTGWDIDNSIREIFRDNLLDRAINGLYYRDPLECAYTVVTAYQFAGFALLAFVTLATFVWYPKATLIAINFIINLGFLVGILFKFIVALSGARFEQFQQITDADVAALSDDELPTYTILVPAYKEAGVIGMLMNNLSHLDYPVSKVEILLLMEEHDHETQEAARNASPHENIHFVIIPKHEPQTKPKACNVGLFFAKGEYLVIYDAEDRPDPDQLKKALIAFRRGPQNMAVVQAALNYFNHNENFLTRMFTLEYSYWFDYMLPGLDHLGLPIPLGGTSNHFRTDVLRELGGWDPFNVTEDADLGIRASANGYTVGIINSTTYEEANNRTGNWIRQRSRWIKGYMQTVLVHLRHPVRLVQRTGIWNVLAFFLLIAGTPFVFLAYPITLFTFFIGILFHFDWLPTLFPPAVLYISMFNFLFGNAIMIYLNMLAVFKRHRYELFYHALLNPIYWILHAIAAYKALYQLVVRPFYWEKTQHGISNQIELDSATHTNTAPITTG